MCVCVWAVGVRFFIQLSQLRTLSSSAHAENMVALGIRTTPIEIVLVWSACTQCNCSTSMPELVDFECADDCQGLLSAVYICLHDISMIFPWFHTLIPWACHLVVSSEAILLPRSQRKCHKQQARATCNSLDWWLGHPPQTDARIRDRNSPSKMESNTI